jgi:hypothetical protein
VWFSKGATSANARDQAFGSRRLDVQDVKQVNEDVYMYICKSRPRKKAYTRVTFLASGSDVLPVISGTALTGLKNERGKR